MTSSAVRRPPWADIAVAAVLLAITVAVPDTVRSSSALSAAVAMAGVALRRVWPLAACVLAACGLLLRRASRAHPRTSARSSPCW